MTTLFLKAKHWQLFLLTFGLPMIFQYFMIGAMFTHISTATHPDPSIIFNYMKFFPLIMIVFTGILFCWLWSVAIGLQKVVPADVKMKVTKFKIFFFFQIVYLICFLLFLGISINGILTGETSPDGGRIGAIFGIILPLHFFSMFCIFYCLYFVAKTFKTVELQREVKFEEFAGEFFMIWFYPIGCWIIQPRINKLINERPESVNIR